MPRYIYLFSKHSHSSLVLKLWLYANVCWRKTHRSPGCGQEPLRTFLKMSSFFHSPRKVIRHLLRPGLHSALGKREASVLGTLRLMEWGATLHKGHGQNPSLPACIGHALHLPKPFISVRDGNTHSRSWEMSWLTYRHTELRSQDTPGVFPFLSTPPLPPNPFQFDFYSTHSTNNAFLSSSIFAAALDPTDSQTLPFFPCPVLFLSL